MTTLAFILKLSRKMGEEVLNGSNLSKLSSYLAYPFKIIIITA